MPSGPVGRPDTREAFLRSKRQHGLCLFVVVGKPLAQSISEALAPRSAADGAIMLVLVLFAGAGTTRCSWRARSAAALEAEAKLENSRRRTRRRGLKNRRKFDS